MEESLGHGDSLGNTTARVWDTVWRQLKNTTLVLVEMTVEAQWVLGGAGQWIGAAYWGQGCVLR